MKSLLTGVLISNSITVLQGQTTWRNPPSQMRPFLRSKIVIIIISGVFILILALAIAIIWVFSFKKYSISQQNKQTSGTNMTPLSKTFHDRNSIYNLIKKKKKLESQSGQNIFDQGKHLIDVDDESIADNSINTDDQVIILKRRLRKLLNLNDSIPSVDDVLSSEKDLEFMRYFPKPKFDCRKALSLIKEAASSLRNIKITPLLIQNIPNKNQSHDGSNQKDSIDIDGIATNENCEHKEHDTNNTYVGDRARGEKNPFQLSTNWGDLIRLSSDPSLTNDQWMCSSIINDFFELLFIKSESLADASGKLESAFNTGVCGFVSDQKREKIIEIK
jgi:oligoribonuclease (3'-5' exoribonuclease)